MAQTRDTLLAVLRRTCDPNWLDGILADADSTALLYAQLDILVAASVAVQQSADAGMISTAPGGRPGVTTLTAARVDTSTAVTIPRGYAFGTDKGVALILTQDIAVAIGQATITLPLQTVRQTFLANTVNDAFDFVGDGEYLDVAVSPSSPVIDDGTAPVLGPPGTATGDHFLTLSADEPITLGEVDWLSAHGNERGQRRQASETTEDYRLRVRNIPDSVSPHAIATAVRGVGARVGIAPITVKEPFADGSDQDVQQREGLGHFETYYASGVLPAADSPMVDFLDDPYYAPPVTADPRFDRETVSSREGRAYFRVETPGQIVEPDGLVFFSDASFCDDPVFGYVDVGVHPAIISALMAIWEEANRKRAAAVQFDVLLPIPQEKVASGHSAVAGTHTVATVSATAGRAWLLVDLVVGHDAALSGVAPDPAADGHQVTFTFTDASTFTTPAFTAIYSEHLSISRLSALGFPFTKRVSSIAGKVTGTGARDLNMVVDARVIEAAI